MVVVCVLGGRRECVRGRKSAVTEEARVTLEVRVGRTEEEVRGGETVSQSGDKKRQRRREGGGGVGVQIVGER